MKILRHTVLSAIAVGLIVGCVSENNNAGLEREKIQTEIEKILKIQEDAYDQHSDEGRAALAATCVDSLIFIGGDNGGQAITSDYYVHDLADGYSKRPYKRTYRIFDQTVIVTSIQQSFKIFDTDTIYFNARSTKVFVKVQDSWKMAYVTYAPLPVIYTRPGNVSPNLLKEYTGFYSGIDGAIDTVSLLGNNLWIGAGPEKSELIPINDSTFFSRDYFGKTGFIWKNQKVTDYFYEFPDGQRLVFPKKRSN